ncbi:unnamed protein product [Sphagnum balticum]
MDGCSLLALCLEDYSSKLSTISWAPILESQPSHKKPDYITQNSQGEEEEEEEVPLMAIDQILCGILFQRWLISSLL